MAETKKANETPAGPAKTPLAVPDPAARTPGVGSASRQAAKESTTPKGEARGSTLDAGQEDAKADYAKADHAKPTGLQAEDAIFDPLNGEVISNMVASPTGLVPVSLVASSPQEAEKLLEERRETAKKEVERRDPYRELSQKEIDEMDGGTLRALADMRGYDSIGGAGTRRARREFARLQSEEGKKK